MKTTYYLHMMPRHTAEQSTIKVNKAAALAPAGTAPRRGFGSRAAAAPAVAVPVAVVPVAPDPVVTAPADAVELDVVDGAACPVDPMERLQCDSCQ